MDEGKPISGFAQNFVARKLKEIWRGAYDGSGLNQEHGGSFTEGVAALAERVRRPDLRQHILREACDIEKHCDDNTTVRKYAAAESSEAELKPPSRSR